MKNKSKPKKQHVIPHFLIRYFAINLDGKTKQVWLHRKDIDKATRANTKNVFAQNNFYTFPDGDTSLEEMLSHSEASYAKAIEDAQLKASQMQTCQSY